ncbi:MAG: hypothetical protein FWE99_07240 [Bacteroidales bacterium]|nr:hypothetical protein [Bacteroidales bacterium]
MKLLLLIFFMGMFSVSAKAAEDVSPKIKAEMVKRTSEVFDRVEEMFKKRGYSLQRPAIENCRAYRTTRSTKRREELHLYMPSMLSVHFLPKNLEIIFFSNAAQKRSITTEGSQLRIYAEKQEPKLSKEEVIEIATEFATAVLGKFPTNVGKAMADWEVHSGMAKFENGETKSGYQHGFWRVKWPRVTEEGYPFCITEGLAVNLYENVGPVLVDMDIVTQFGKVNFTPVKVEDVMEIARASAKKLMKWGPTKDVFADLTFDPNPLDQSLYVVRPNHITKSNDIPGDGGAIKGRLAWDITFGAYAPGQTRETTKIPRAYLIIWIDAQNKEFLGGDVQIN